MIANFFQTDPRLNPKIQQFGCALLDAHYIAPTLFTPEDVNSMYEELLGVGFINADCLILDWEKVLWSIGANMHFAKKAPKEYICAPGEREILKWYLWNVKENHFTVGDGSSNTAWDSMNRADVMNMRLPNGAPNANFVEKVIVKIT
jgi:hypothetical protein